MKILRVVPLPPEFIGGIPFYYKNLSFNLFEKKNVECDILTPDLYNTNKDIDYIHNGIRVIYKKCYGYLANKNPLSYILSLKKKNTINMI